FDRYAQSTKGKKGTAEVDREFLKEIESWRELLAKNIALRNPDVSIYELNYAVQKIIDRIIFLRICEDRGIEHYGQLQTRAEGDKVYTHLLNHFKLAESKYNSGIFDFDADKITSTLTIDDKVLKTIILGLYYPKSPYEFSVFGVEILGNVYEQFLGKVIRLTAGHQAKVETKPEVKKAGGVYYTPQYIVEYIVKNTVGKLIAGKTPEEIAEIKVLDPACGSGSFLIGAYSYLLRYHQDWYVSNKPKKHKGKMFLAKENEWYLTTAEKKRILLNNIHGVDIDPQAVEVTKMSLLLKVLEHESRESIDQQAKLGLEGVLPNLADNIKCGNSLIGLEYYEQQQETLFDEAEMRRVNVFDWEDDKKGFGEILKKGGFDCVVGNPPYVDVKLLGDDIKQILSKHFSSATRRFDLYVPFVEQGLKLLSKKGLLGYIIPSMFARREYGRDLRRTINKLGTIEGIVDFGTNQVFNTAMNYVGVFIMGKTPMQNDVPVIRCERAGIVGSDLQRCLMGEKVRGVQSFLAPANIFNTSDEWYFLSREEFKLIHRLFNSFINLGTIISHASEGIHSGKDTVFFVPKKTVHDLSLETPPVYPLAKGKDIHRYQAIVVDNLSNFVIYPYDLASEKVYDKAALQNISPNTWAYLNKSKNLLKGRGYFDRSNKLWYELWCPRNSQLYTAPKIVGPEIASRGEFTLCKEQLFINNKLKALILRDDVNEQLEYILGLLNSSLLGKLHRLIAPPKGGGFFEVKTRVMSRLPISTINFSNPAEKAQHDKLVALVDNMLELQKKYHEARMDRDKELYERQIKMVDAQIDRLVYDLYGLTEEEVKVVGGKVKNVKDL
ncbi:hypothetical protein C5S31_07080, partial [ANME-1 cluster archaeon GoMg2]|nr:hypothetical protein [ANME-1 cluster archaeon GoMg2]